MYMYILPDCEQGFITLVKPLKKDYYTTTKALKDIQLCHHTDDTQNGINLVRTRIIPCTYYHRQSQLFLFILFGFSDMNLSHCYFLLTESASKPTSTIQYVLCVLSDKCTNQYWYKRTTGSAFCGSDLCTVLLAEGTISPGKLVCLQSSLCEQVHIYWSTISADATSMQ